MKKLTGHFFMLFFPPLKKPCFSTERQKVSKTLRLKKDAEVTYQFEETGIKSNSVFS